MRIRQTHLFTVLMLLMLFALALRHVEAANRVSQRTRSKLHKELPILTLAVGDPVLIRTFKKESRLELWMKPQDSDHYTLFRTYPICYYSGGLGPKLRVGDKVTPEGFYAIKTGALQPNSRFHLSMNIGFPNAYDRYYGRTGSLLMIHGACDAIGCFAMSNPQIEEIYYLVEQAMNHGQTRVPVHAFPFHLTADNMNAYRTSPWFDFWQQLKVGYDMFNEDNIPPTVSVDEGRYLVTPGV